MTEYTQTIAKIRDTHIGFEDHGNYTVNINFEGASWGQGTGHHFVSTSVGEYPNREQVGTAYGMNMILGIIQAVGVERWEDLKGKTVFILRDEDDPFGMIKGIENLPTEKGKRVIFRDIWERYGQEGE